MRHHLPRTRWALMVLALGIVTAAANASVDSDSGRLGTMAARCTPDATPGWTQHWELGAAPDRAGHMWVRHRETNI
jgi:hypothetical protein